MARVRNSFWSKQIDKLVQSENIPVVFKKYLNFGIDGGETGYGFRDEAGVIQWKNSGGAWTNISAGGGGGSAHIIQDEGTPLTQRSNLNFVGSGVTVTDGGAGPDSTIVTVTASSGLKLPTLTVGASGADYTTIQGALDAIGINGGKIYLTDATYTITSAITFKGSGVEIVGNSNGTQINADGAVVTTLVTTNATTYQRIAIRDVTFNQTNGTVQGIGVDFSNISLAIIKNVRILNFGTAIKLNNTTNNNFYSHYEDIKISGCNNGIDCTSTTPFNFNTFINIRTALRAGGAGVGLILNNAQGNGFYNFNAEPATGAGITGVAMTTANVFDNNFYNLYCENNNIGVTMDLNTQRNNFYGGNVIASITTNFIDSGKYNQRYGLNVGTTVDYRNVYSNTRFVSTGAAPITLSDFTNNTSFAHSAGSLVNMSLLNATDTSDTLEVANASTSTGLALDIKNSFGFSRGTNFSTIGSSNNVTFSNHSYIRCNGASAQTITGIANGKDGRFLVLRNTTGNPLTLNHEDTNSTATNRLLCPAAVNYVVVAGASVTLIYDPSDARWALLIPDIAIGSGDVVGPASAVAEDIATYNGTTGKLIKDSSLSINKVKNLMSSSLVNGPAVMTIGTPTSKFNVPAFTAQFVDNWTNPLVPVVVNLSYAGSTNNTITNLATQDATYISFDKDGILYQSAAFTSGAALRDKVQIGAIVHPNRTSISYISTYTANLAVDIAAGLSDLSQGIGFINSGNRFSANGANLKVNKSLGSTTYIGLNSQSGSHSPNITTDSALTAPIMFQTWRNGSGGWVTNSSDTVVPSKYDNNTAGGVTSPNGVLNSNKWQLIKLYYSPELGLTGCEYGQTIYNSQAEAEAARSTETTANPFFNGTSFRGWLIVRGGATNLSLTADSVFLDSGKFSSTTGGTGSGSATTTLQQAYDNSSVPLILTNPTLDGFSVQRGSAADTDPIFKGLNGAGATTFSVTGAGVIAGANLSGTNTGDGMVQQTPAGTVNGSNVTFTVTVAPKFILTDTGMYIEGFGYTLATLTVTMDLAPNLFIRAYY